MSPGRKFRYSMNRTQLKIGWFGTLRAANALAALLAAAAFLLPARAQEEITGIPGVATNKATINFQALADWEVQFKSRRGTNERPQRVTPYQNLYANATNEAGGERE